MSIVRVAHRTKGPHFKSRRTIDFPLDPMIVALRARRIQLRKTQLEVSIDAGFGVRSIEWWETGRVTPGLFNLRAWANSLGVDLLLGELN